MAQSPDMPAPVRASWLALPPEPWKNGGGVTRKLAEDAAARWRVSIADIGGDGPYSCFPGYDRVSVVLSGQGVELSGEGAAVSLRPGAPARFAGDTAFQSRLVGGPVRVLNLFVLRGAAQARVACLGGPEHACMAGSLPDAAREGPRTRLIVAVSAGRLRGPVPGAQWELDAGDFTVGHGGDAPDLFIPAEAPAPGHVPALRLDITVLASGPG
ncbi:HutD family protein [Achromobacter deleyi]|uniref:HutD/Ves family protein n=1 Tax=Achromobacter deleyi TaxID=1353891 RepID=UPI001F465DCD|nr:HutD family protein [Achromobacter deleyi]UIP19027.1 HutD family protein [Achromobacter deleyi]